MNANESELPEFLSLIGKKYAVEAIEKTWQKLTEPAELFKPTLEVNRLPDSMLTSMGITSTDVQYEFASIFHAPGIGDILLGHLKNECNDQLGITEPDIRLTHGFYFEPS